MLLSLWRRLKLHLNHQIQRFLQLMVLRKPVRQGILILIPKPHYLKRILLVLFDDLQHLLRLRQLTFYFVEGCEYAQVGVLRFFVGRVWVLLGLVGRGREELGRTW